MGQIIPVRSEDSSQLEQKQLPGDDSDHDGGGSEDWDESFDFVQTVIKAPKPLDVVTVEKGSASYWLDKLPVGTNAYVVRVCARNRNGRGSWTMANNENCAPRNSVARRVVKAFITQF
jgi:hypothetical protein